MFNARGEQLASEQLRVFSQQLNEFTTKFERYKICLNSYFLRLEQFAHRHRGEIKKNSQFRRHFQEMCASVGVDPLACKFPNFVVKLNSLMF